MSTGEYRLIPLAEFRESPHNPRKTFNPVKLAELTASIKAKGVVTPVLVRPATGGGYELAAGHRRCRASELAGLTVVPAIVREMSDEDFLEVLTIENLQREDVEPLEEADGYRVLIDTWRAKREAIGAKGGYKDDVERVAARIGKSTSYVYQRLKLLGLGEQGRRYLQDGVITAGHAIILARLQPADQAKALEEYLVDNCGGETECPVSVRDFSHWVKHAFHCRLANAPFRLQDNGFRGVGACTTCPKRSGYEEGTKAKDDLCMDRSCFAAKCAEFIERELSVNPSLLRLSYDYSPDSKLRVGRNRVLEGANANSPCAREAIYVDGPKIGTTEKVCGLGADCPTHKRSSAVVSSLSADEKRRREKAKSEASRREAWEDIWHELKVRLATFWGLASIDPTSVSRVLQGFSDEQLGQFLVALTVGRELLVGPYNESRPVKLDAMAAIFGVDPEQVKPPAPQVKEPKGRAVQTSAKGGGAVRRP